MTAFKNTSLRYGLLGGVAVVFYFALLYTIGPQHFLNPWLQWASMGLYLLFMYRAAKEDCAQYGANRDFRAILRIPFIVFILINLFYWLFYYGLHLADIELIRLELLTEKQACQTQIDDGTGDPQVTYQLRERINEIEIALQQPVQPLGPVITRMAMGAIGGFALSAGIAAILRTSD
ncbi:MAG: DUF4199 family protein [Lewinellaceae bacterium]|nr:DUF4199 family protein [Saprospiraceae bacterium]MCB9316718.1 DUF4199 family protein [Lewinellaceae bacterium]MCB9332671.1 DUF4199 family protein [Lewinellaceae bacterium]